MSQHYSNPRRAGDKFALPDIEVFMACPIECRFCGHMDSIDECDTKEGVLICDECGKRTQTSAAGPPAWWWWCCLPGCLPDSEAHGPFDTEEMAIGDMRENYDDVEEAREAMAEGGDPIDWEKVKEGLE